jgi:hypothetical protein
VKSFKGYIRNLVFNVARLAGVERQSNLMGEIRAEQIRQKGKLTCLADAEFSVFSQWGEDGILSWLIDVISPNHRTFVEFGIEDYREANTRHLLMSRNWTGLVIDGSESNISALKRDSISYKYDLKSVCGFITRDNINDLIANSGFADHLGILSVDIDGVDYWVLEKIQNRADVVVVEYNDLFGDFPISVPYDPAFIRLEKHWSGIYWGASLTAFNHLLNGRGMRFVGTNRAGTNAFFVKEEHETKVRSRLTSVQTWNCAIREVRNRDGSLAFRTYRECAHFIADLPVVDVTTGQQHRFSELGLESLVNRNKPRSDV